MTTDTCGQICMFFYGNAGRLFPDQKAIILPEEAWGMKRSQPNSAQWEEWIKQQLDKFPALTEERWAKIAAIVAGSRQHAMDRIDQFDQSA